MADIDTETLRQNLSDSLARITDAGIKRQITGDRQIDYLTPGELLQALERVNAIRQSASQSSTNYATGGDFS